MQLSETKSLQRTFLPHANASAPAAKRKPHKPAPAEKEIHSYIAIRDNFLAEAEAATTSKNLDRLSAANDFVTTCLNPARAPYQAQCLPEAEAKIERVRCHSVRVHVSALRAKLSLKMTHARAA